MLKVNNADDRAMTKSGAKKFRLYDLRHTWATRAAEDGIDVGTLASLLGHSTLIMVMRYVHPGESHRVEERNCPLRTQRDRLPNSKRRKKTHRKAPLQFPLQCPKILPILKGRKRKVSLSRSTKRRRSDSNRCIKVLQTSPLPLGYGAVYAKHFIITKQGREISGVKTGSLAASDRL